MFSWFAKSKLLGAKLLSVGPRKRTFLSAICMVGGLWCWLIICIVTMTSWTSQSDSVWKRACRYPNLTGPRFNKTYYQSFTIQQSFYIKVPIGEHQGGLYKYCVSNHKSSEIVMIHLAWKMLTIFARDIPDLFMWAILKNTFKSIHSHESTLLKNIKMFIQPWKLFSTYQCYSVRLWWLSGLRQQFFTNLSSETVLLRPRFESCSG